MTKGAHAAAGCRHTNERAPKLDRLSPIALTTLESVIEKRLAWLADEARNDFQRIVKPHSAGSAKRRLFAPLLHALRLRLIWQVCAVAKTKAPLQRQIAINRFEVARIEVAEDKVNFG